MQDADSDEPAGCMLLQLSRPAAAVLASVVRSAPASKAAGALVLSHLAAFGSGDVSGKRVVLYGAVRSRGPLWNSFVPYRLRACVCASYVSTVRACVRVVCTHCVS